MVNDYESFIEGTEDSYTVDLGDPVGEVEGSGGAFRALLPRVGRLALASGGSGSGAGRAETQGSAATAHPPLTASTRTGVTPATGLAISTPPSPRRREN